MKRALNCLVMILAAAGSMFAAASVEKEPEAGSKPTVIRFAHSWSYGFSDMLEQFQRGFSNEFRIEEETSVGLQHKEKILIDVSSDDLPDVFTFWSYETNLGYFKKHKLIIDIQEYFNASSERSREDFYPSAMKATEINGINYAIPHEQIFGFFIINSEIFESLRLKVPKTWKDIKEMTPILLENGITPLSMGSFKGDPGHLFFSALTYQTEGGLEDTINLKKSRNFIYPGTINAAKAVLDLIKYNAVPSNSIYAGSWDHQINEYNERKAAMIFSFNWNLALFKPEIADSSTIIPVPRISDKALDTSRFTVGGIAMSICINSKSWNDPEKRDAIIRLVDWLLSDEVFIARLNQQGTFPTRYMALPDYRNSMYGKVQEYIRNTKVCGIHEFYFTSLNEFNRYKEANDLLWSGTLDQKGFLEYVQQGITPADE